MAQMAQMVDLKVESTTTQAALSADVKNRLIECIKAGTILDVVLTTTEAAKKINTTKVVGYSIDSTGASPKYKISIANCETSGTPFSTIALN